MTLILPNMLEVIWYVVFSIEHGDSEYWVLEHGDHGYWVLNMVIASIKH